MGVPRDRLLIDQLCIWLWHIDGREAVGPESSLEQPGIVSFKQRSAAGARLARGPYATTSAAVTLTG
jgi:hypothetical protein